MAQIWYKRMFARVIAIGFACSAGAAIGKPAATERIYLIEKRHAPVSIVTPKEYREGNFLRDPDRVRSVPPANVRRAKSAPRAKVERSDRSHLKFRRLQVSGRTTEPRLRFQLDKLDVGRVENIARPGFVDRIFTDATSPQF